ncbi:hypothetical protein GCM10027416_14270 [Okibacterium endophyticum]
MENLTLQLADKFRSIGVGATYGEPIDVEGSTIVPVAFASYGFGAGEGEGEVAEENHGAGEGGGGGGCAIPLGAYVKTRDGLHFEPNVVSLLAIGIPFVWVAGKALAGIIKALKK